MLKTHLIIKYDISKTSLHSKSAYEELSEISRDALSGIIGYLNDKGIECGKIKEGCWCVGSMCRVVQRKVSILVSFPSNSLREETAIMDLNCSNYFSSWRYIFNRPKDETIYSGQALQEFVKLVDEAIRNNDRIAVHRDWIEHSEYLSTIQPKCKGSIGLLKDPLRKKGFWDV